MEAGPAGAARRQVFAGLPRNERPLRASPRASGARFLGLQA